MDIVIFDGKCNFCTSGINKLRRLDIQKVLEFVSLHDPSVTERFPDLTYDMMMDQMWVIASNGDRYGGADAVRYLSRRLILLYPFAPILHLPGLNRLWHKIYRAVAARRYRIAGRNCSDGTCSVHAQHASEIRR